MKKPIFLLLMCLFSTFLFGQSEKYAIIPQPVTLTPTEGTFVLSSSTRLIFKNITEKEAPSICYFDKKMEALLGFSMIKNQLQNPNRGNEIIVTMYNQESISFQDHEKYHLEITPEKINIQAHTDAGLFYALQTLYQLMPAEIYGKQPLSTKNISIPACIISDYPRFPYRGSHLDVCRHFLDLEYVKKHIDLISQYKINYFHWHLTDDQGWRIEIKQYPRLQTIASKRKETWIGHFTSGLGYDGTPHGGYYTQEQIKEVLQYAAERHVMVIPEIELPGHALAALSAYPEFSCTGGPHEVVGTWGVFDDVYCPTEETFTFLENVLDEVIALFPDAPFIHIGGDECPKVRWEKCPKCQERIKKEGLKNEQELQSYFLNRIAQYIIAHRKQVIAWDEALEGGIPDGVTIMSWQGEKGGIEAAKLNHNVIMTPCAYMYLNYYQGEPENEPLAIGGFVPLEKVYRYDPIPRGISKEQQHFILGPQANLWTEYITNPKEAEYMLFPRMCAMSEGGWTPKESKNYDSFVQRLYHHFDILDAENVNYSKSHFNIKSATLWNKKVSKPEVTLSSACPDCEIRYTLHGEIPNLTNSIIYQAPILIDNNTDLRAAAFKNDKLFSAIFKESYLISKSTGRSYVMQNINPQYNGGHELALTDGILGNMVSWNKWVGTLGNDLDVVIDLENQEAISNVNMQFLHNPGSWIFAPIEVTLWISNDNNHWTKIETKDLRSHQKSDKQEIISVDFSFPIKESRYVKVIGSSLKKCPKGHPGEGYESHLFINEIIVN